MTDALPQHCPTPRELDDLELIAHGAVQPAGFTDDPQGVTLTLPTVLAADGTVELRRPDGVATLTRGAIAMLDAGGGAQVDHATDAELAGDPVVARNLALDAEL